MIMTEQCFKREEQQQRDKRSVLLSASEAVPTAAQGRMAALPKTDGKLQMPLETQIGNQLQHFNTFLWRWVGAWGEMCVWRRVQTGRVYTWHSFIAKDGEDDSPPPPQVVLLLSPSTLRSLLVLTRTMK